MREGRAAVAARHFERAVRQARSRRGHHAAAGADRSRRGRISPQGIPQRRLPRRAARPRCTAPAISRRSTRSTLPQSGWRHSQALQANGKAEAGRRGAGAGLALCCSRGIASLSDEGLRRNYLNKREENREIVLAWLAHAREPQAAAQAARGASRRQGSLREPFERLVDTGLRLERDQERGRASRVPGRRSHRTVGRRARAAGAGGAGRAAGSRARRLAGAARRGRRTRCCKPSRHGSTRHAATAPSACATRPRARRRSTSASRLSRR